MNVFIARDGVEIGECPRDEIADYVRSGEILPTDHYWHAGMEGWGVVGEQIALPMETPPEEVPEELPIEDAKPATQPRNWRIIAGAAAALFLAVTAIGAFLINPGGAPFDRRAKTTLGNPAPSPQMSYAEVRDKAAAELQATLDRLPKKIMPPATTYYYDVSATMNRALTSRLPWTAVIRGFENSIDPSSQETVSRAEITVNAEYIDGVWTYNSYHAVLTGIAGSAPSETEHKADMPAPPAVVALLGLKIPDRPSTSISITR